MEQADHRRFEEDLAAYLLDALDPDELRQFRMHLEGCARCRHEERWLRAAVDQLPSSVDQLEPPRQLRNRLMARVQIEAAADRKGHRRSRRWAIGLRPAAALATAAVIAAGIVGYVIGNDNGPETTTVQAEATKASPTAQATVVRTDDSAVLKVARLPVQRRGHVYQTWLQRGKQIVPSSLFVVNKNGSGSAAVTGSLDGVDAVMVSEEPDGGSPQPTSDPVLIAKL
jgi:anti-sigma-K factor RskA